MEKRKTAQEKLRKVRSTEGATGREEERRRRAEEQHTRQRKTL